METSVEPLEGNKVKLSVRVDEQEFDEAVGAAFRKISREVRIPGFRPGKAPRRILEAHLGTDTARREALRDALPEYYARALRERDVDAIAPPEIDITEGEETGPVSFDAVVEVRPRVDVPGYQGLQVTIPSPATSDEEIDRQVDRLRSQFGELQMVSRPARDGDHVTIDINGYRHSEAVEGMSATDLLYEVGSATIVPELDEQLRGSRAGDILKFNAPVPGQDDDVTFQVLVKEVKEKLLPDVTDEWASEASEFDTVAELRDDIRTRISQVKRVQAQLALRDNVVEALVALVADDAPDPLVGAEMERRLHELAHRLEAQGATIAQYLEATDRSQEALLDDLKATAVESVKADLALRAVADAEDIEVADEDVDAEVARMAERLGRKLAEVRRQLERAEQMPAVRSDLRKAKALEWLVERVDIVDEEGRSIERSELELAPQVEAQQGESEDEKTGE